ncbi:MAG: hypothetical protein RML94_09285 [Bacteroidia bacterium]|nr:hypothetical protein [Bacteroidia bacterium]
MQLEEKKIINRLIIVSSAVAAFFVFKSISNKIKQKQEVKKTEEKLSSLVVVNGKRYNPQLIAEDIRNKLGLSYPWYDPRRWTEEDNYVRDLLLSLPKTVVHRVAVEYKKMYSEDLVTQLSKYLDDWDKIKHLFIK